MTRQQYLYTLYARLSPASREALRDYIDGYMDMDEVQSVFNRNLYDTDIEFRMMNMGIDEDAQQSIQMLLLSAVLLLASQYSEYDAAHPVTTDAVCAPKMPARIDVWQTLDDLSTMSAAVKAVLEPMRVRVGIGAATDADAGLMLFLSTLSAPCRAALEAFINDPYENYNLIFVLCMDDVYGSRASYYEALSSLRAVDGENPDAKIVANALQHVVRAAVCRLYESLQREIGAVHV